MFSVPGFRVETCFRTVDGKNLEDGGSWAAFARLTRAARCTAAGSPDGESDAAASMETFSTRGWSAIVAPFRREFVAAEV